MASNKARGPLDTVGVGIIATPSKDASDFEGAVYLKGDLDWKMVIGFGEEGSPGILLQELDPKG